MDSALQIALIYDLILIAILAVVAVLGWKSVSSIWAFNKRKAEGEREDENAAAYNAEVSRLQKKAANWSLVTIVVVIAALIYANREAIWFRPEPKPVVNPERQIRIEEIAGRQIIVKDPVNVPERQKMDPEDLAVKDKVENMEDLDGGPE